MKNKSILLLIIIAAISLLVSCNLDSTDGIGTLVRNDQYEESFRTSRIIGVLDDGYYVSTDKGIREYSYTYDDKSQSYKYSFKELSNLNIDNPKGVVIMDKNTIIYEKSEGGFIKTSITGDYSITNPNNSVNMTSLIDSYTTDGKYFTLIFKGKDNNYYPATFDASSSVDSGSFNFYPVTIDNAYKNNISIIGKNAIKYSTTRGNSTGSADYYYILDFTDSTATPKKVIDSTYQKKYLIGGTYLQEDKTKNRIVVDLNGRVYVDDKYMTQSVSNAIITKLPIVSDATRTLFIYSGRVIYTDNATSTTFNSKSSSNLSSTMIPIMIKKHNTDNNLYLVFTELSGAYVYDFANNTMTSLGKKNTGYSIKDFQ